MSHRLIRLQPESLTLSGLPIHVARIPAAPFPRAPFSLTSRLIGSFAPAQEPLPSRLFRLPRGFPGRGVRPARAIPSISQIPNLLDSR